MAYDKINWVDYEEGQTTPVNADNLNHMDDGIYDNANDITSMKASITADETTLAAKSDKAEAVGSLAVSGKTITYKSVSGTSLGTVTTQDTTYSAATQSAAGLMSAADKAKLDGVTASADAVSFSRSLTSGTKIGTLTINGTATDLYSTNDTTYSNATASAAGLMSNSDYYKLSLMKIRDYGFITATASVTIQSGVSASEYEVSDFAMVVESGLIPVAVASFDYTQTDGAWISISGTTSLVREKIYVGSVTFTTSPSVKMKIGWDSSDATRTYSLTVNLLCVKKTS